MVGVGRVGGWSEWAEWAEWAVWAVWAVRQMVRWSDGELLAESYSALSNGMFRVVRVVRVDGVGGRQMVGCSDGELSAESYSARSTTLNEGAFARPSLPSCARGVPTHRSQVG